MFCEVRYEIIDFCWNTNSTSFLIFITKHIDTVVCTFGNSLVISIENYLLCIIISFFLDLIVFTVCSGSDKKLRMSLYRPWGKNRLPNFSGRDKVTQYCIDWLLEHKQLFLIPHASAYRHIVRTDTDSFKAKILMFSQFLCVYKLHLDTRIYRLWSQRIVTTNINHSLCVINVTERMLFCYFCFLKLINLTGIL